MSERRETIFYDSSAAMDRIGSDKIELGQRRAVAAHDVFGRVIGRDSEVAVRWTPAHQGVEGNEMAGTWAKAAVIGSFFEDGQAYLREVSLSYTTRTAEARSQATVRWISDHVREGQEALPPPEGQRRETGASAGGGGFTIKFLTGHASISSYLCGKIQVVESNGCWWCGSDERQFRFHLVARYRSWVPQAGDVEKIGKACGWRHPRVSSVRKMFDDERATEAMLAFFRDTRWDGVLL